MMHLMSRWSKDLLLDEKWQMFLNYITLICLVIDVVSNLFNVTIVICTRKMITLYFFEFVMHKKGVQRYVFYKS
jgi:hypothetical protein